LCKLFSIVESYLLLIYLKHFEAFLISLLISNPIYFLYFLVSKMHQYQAIMYMDVILLHFYLVHLL
jgi:hypothetical protein